MYQINDTVLYGINGVCRIENITEETIGNRKALYYMLKPVYNDSSTIFVPLENSELTGKMRRILSASEIYSIIRSMPEEEPIWNDDEGERNAMYREILKSGDCVKIVRLIKTLYFHKQKQINNKKKLHVADEKIMKEAEKILYEEFAYVLDIKPDQVVSFITEQIKIAEKQGNI